MKRNYRLLVCGSGKLSNELVDFVKLLGEKIIEKTNLILLTGGLKVLKKGIPTLDYTVAKSAKKKVNSIKQDPSQRIVTLLPYSDSKKLTRFRYGDVKIVSQASPKARRFFMVNESDVILSIEGRDATKEIIYLAWASKKPILPLPFTGGSSQKRWKKYLNEISRQFYLDNEEIKFLESKEHDIGRMAEKCIEIIQRPLKARCFIAMQYENHEFPGIYQEIKQIVEEKGYEAIRVDKAISSGNIVNAIWDLISVSDLLIVDISGYSPNVFYELGIAHALGKKTLIFIYNRSGKVPDDIPFNIRTESIFSYRDIDSLKQQINKLV